MAGACSGAGGAVGDGPDDDAVDGAGADASCSLQSLDAEGDGGAVVSGRVGEGAAGAGALGDEVVDEFVAGGDVGVAGSAGAACGLLHDRHPFGWPVG